MTRGDLDFACCCGSVARAVRLIAVGVFGLGVLRSPIHGMPQEPRTEQSGVFILIPDRITATTIGGVSNRINAAKREGARKIIFAIKPGQNDYEDCLKLVRLIGGVEGARTIAYVSETLTGHAVMVALAADELVMSPGARIGDIGRAESAITEPMRVTYADLARRRKPQFVAVILGMLDKNLRVHEIRTGLNTRYVLDEELNQAGRDAAVVRTKILKDRGELILLGAEQAREMGLVDRLSESRERVAEAYGLPARVAKEDPLAGERLHGVRIRVEGEVTSLIADFVQRSIRGATNTGSNLIVFDFDSLGGAPRACRDLANLIHNLDPSAVRTVAFVNKQACGATAFVALACDEILVHPDAKFGDCSALLASMNSGRPGFVRDVSKELQALAEGNGYPPALAVGVVDSESVVHEVTDPGTGRITTISDAELQAAAPGTWRPIRVVKQKGDLVTLTGRQMREFGFATAEVDEFAALCEYLGVERSDVRIMTATWVDDLIWWLNRKWISAVLLALGIVSLYVELKLPGIGLPSILSAICFVLFFWSKFMGGTAGALEILLFVGGVFCLAVEIFLLPGSLVFGVSGVLLTAVSLILASQTFIWPHGATEWTEFSGNIGSLIGAFTTLFVAAFFLSKYLPHVPLLNRMVLVPELASRDPDVPADWGGLAASDLIGATGLAMTTLRPAGRIRLGEDFIDVVTEGSFVEAGRTVRVVAVHGNRVVVKEHT